MPGPARVLVCGCAFADIIPADTKAQALARLRAAGVAFEAVPDLCALAARRDPLLARLAQAESPIIIACYPRAVRWLFAYAGAPLPSGAEILNLRVLTPEDVAERIPECQAPASGSSNRQSPIANRQSEEPHSEAAEGAEERRSWTGAQAHTPHSALLTPQWVPWFPVIDRARCSGCQQCLNFCIFGVYALDAEGKVEVRNPANCKTNCPACARICPEVAIIFPKHPTSPINGDEVTPEHLASKEVRVDPTALAGGDVYAALRERSRRARPSELTLASGEQLCACMAEELQKKLGIPPEVLQTLSLQDVRARLQADRGATEEKHNG